MKWRRIATDKSKYMAELTELLSFMSSWDRKTVLDDYAARFDATDNADTLIEEIGTPMQVAIALASDYTPSPPPAPEEPAAETEIEILDISLEELLAEEDAAEEAAPTEAEAAPEAPEPDDAPAAEPQAVPRSALRPPKPRVKPRGAVLYCVLALLIGLPVSVLLNCIGLPLLWTGVGGAAGTLYAGLSLFSDFRLLSDILLVAGAALVLLAVCIVLAWLGLWLSIRLCTLWLDQVVLPLWGKLACEKEATEA